MRFALITEGISENRIIKHILTKYFRSQELFFRDAQPQIVNDKQETVGGWNEVLKYCERTDDLKEIFNNADFLVIQIDTDQSQTAPFDVNHTRQDASTKPVQELYDNVVNKLKGIINPEVMVAYGNRIFFAICVHTIECWLLPLYYTNHHRGGTRNCLQTLNVQLRREDMASIPIHNKNHPKSIRTYDAILRDWRNKKDLDESAVHNAGFKLFLDSLSEIKI